MVSSLLPLLRTRDHAAFRELLTEGVRFHSPVRDYEGREDAAHLFVTMSGILEEVEPTRELEAGAERTTFITGYARGRRFDGVIDEILDEEGKIDEVTLMLRPLGVLREAVQAMATALEDSPLPSSVGARTTN